MPQWNPREFQEAVNAFLSRQGWTQTELARATGLRTSVVNRWLQPEDSGMLVQPTGESLEKLEPVIGISHDELMRMAGRLRGPKVSTRPPELEQFLRDQEAGWLATDPEQRQWREEVARAVFPHAPRRPARRRGKKGLISVLRTH